MTNNTQSVHVQRLKRRNEKIRLKFRCREFEDTDFFLKKKKEKSKAAGKGCLPDCMQTSVHADPTIFIIT